MYAATWQNIRWWQKKHTKTIKDPGCKTQPWKAGSSNWQFLVGPQSITCRFNPFKFVRNLGGFCWKKNIRRYSGCLRNPAPVDRQFFPLQSYYLQFFMVTNSYQLVQDFLHPQSINSFKNKVQSCRCPSEDYVTPPPPSSLHIIFDHGTMLFSDI